MKQSYWSQFFIQLLSQINQNQKMNDSIQALQQGNFRHARLLLHLFKKQSQSNSKTIAQFIQKYAEGIDFSQGVQSKKDEQLLIAKIKHYKSLIQTATKDSHKTLKSLQNLKSTKYAQIQNAILQKQQAYLDFYSQKLSHYSNPPEQDEQLSRVKTLLSNGLWGNLPRLNQRLSKLSQLESQLIIEQ